MVGIRGIWYRWVIRPIVFVAPLPLIGGWCDLQPTWQLAAWTFFCIFWSECTDGIGKEPSDAGDRKATIGPAPVLLTRTQLAAVDNPLRSRNAARGEDKS
jgi:hypothetical protein